MYTGWLQPFRRKGPITQQEHDTRLLHEGYPGVDPDQHMALVGLNSTYLEWIDRRNFFRGNFGFLFATCFALLFICLSIYFAIFMAFEYGDLSHVLASLFILILWSSLVGLTFKLVLLKDYFTYTYFPIRFNRKTRMVHVFRHNRAGGVLSVPWDDVFFHIGVGTTRKDLLDIRGEVLDGDIVKDTFALGHAVPKNSQRSLLEMWEFIRRYMEEGPEAVGPHPLDRYVELSVEPSWKNCHLVTSTYYAADLPPFFQALVSPLVLLFTLTRWVVLHTCRKPVFPHEIEATCKVDPDDPNVWPVPKSSGEFAATIPGLFEHAKAKALRSWQAEREQQKPTSP